MHPRTLIEHPRTISCSGEVLPGDMTPRPLGKIPYPHLARTDCTGPSLDRELKTARTRFLTPTLAYLHVKFCSRLSPNSRLESTKPQTPVHCDSRLTHILFYRNCFNPTPSGRKLLSELNRITSSRA
ncbi:hypothetical protein FIBSPDRAFT_988903 [Athelia psychrophila]|uniref:Uncharacterized protein n=1 Tax=Athelia psychrophila TaxID=1759441 RepID=A0A166SLJ2_9AGAM|nr:hypothetical protein FIBSPDRAFT_988903 [Fibularhizoctonia sp. CBS 109695]